MPDKKNSYNSILIWVIVAGLFLALLAPAVVANSNFFPYITGKAYLFRIVVEIILAAWVILVVRDRSYLPKKSLLLYSAIGLTVLSFVSDLFGSDFSKSFWSNYERMEGWLMIIHLFAYFVVATSVLNTRKLWNYWIGATLAVSFVLASWGIVQMGCWSPDPDPQYGVKNVQYCKSLSDTGVARLFGGVRVMQGDRLNSTLGNAAYYGFYTLIHVFLGLLLIVRASEGKWKRWTIYASSIAVVFNLIGLYYSGTRGSLVGLLGGLFISGLIYLVWAFRRARSTQSNLPRSWFVILTTFAVVIVAVGSIWAARDSDFVKNSRFLNRYANISISDTKTQARAFIWPMALKGFTEHPILGWGQENFSFVFDKYYDPRMWGHEQWFDRAHNVFLDWLVSGGIIGFLAYLSLYFLPLWYLFRKSKMPISNRVILIGLLVAYGIHNMFVFDNISSYIIFFGLLAYVNYEWVNENSTTSVESRPAIDNSLINYVVVPVVLLLLILVMYTVNIRSIKTNKALLLASATCNGGVSSFYGILDATDPIGHTHILEQLWSCSINLLGSQNAPKEVKSDAYSTSIREVNNEIARSESSATARTYFFAASILSAAGNTKDALVAYEKAHELSPSKPTFLAGEGFSLLSLGRNDEALKSFKQEYDLAPDSPISRADYAFGLIHTGKIDEAMKIVEQSDSATVLSDRLANALYEKKAFKQLIALLKLRIKFDPKNLKNYTSLAAVYIDPAINDRPAARKILLQIKDIDPTQSGAIDTLLLKSGL